MYNALANVSCVSDVYLDNSTAYMTDVNRPTNKIVAKIVDHNKCQQLAQKINEFYPELFSYVSRNWLNITNSQLTKASGVHFLEKYYNFDNYDIYAIGDGLNDISLSEFENSYVIDTSFITVKKAFKNSVNSFEDMINILNERS